MEKEFDLEKRLLLRKRFKSRRPALFLDRDGVLIEEKHYLKDADCVELCSGALQLLETASKAGLATVVITNQSGIARGYFSWKEYDKVTDKMLKLVGRQDLLAAIYANGYGPGAPSNSWRKPSPQMMIVAAEELNLDLAESILVGDRLSDMESGKRAGLKKLFHVSTGHGAAEREAVSAWEKKMTIQNGQSRRTRLITAGDLNEVASQLLS